MCQQLGFKVKSQRRGGRGAQERYFSLDREHYHQLMTIVDRRQARRLATITAIEPEFLSETVVTPVGLNQMDRGNYGVESNPPEFSPGNQLEPVGQSIPVWAPNRFIGQKAFEVISDRVRRQVDMAIGGLRLAMMGKPIGLES
jgi:hypothetical protein